MRGKVLSFNGSTGLISGDDGVRYTFAAVDLQGDSAFVPSGATVDFEPEGSTATSIYVISMAMGDKNKYVAAILACPLVFGLGMFGLHKFYLGRVTAGIVMLLGTILVIPIPVVFVVAFLETIIYLVKSDQSFYEDYVVGGKSWF
jgi:TM2 domain-containing membrane protein YozV